MAPAQLPQQSNSYYIGNLLRNKTSVGKVGKNCGSPDTNGLKRTNNSKDFTFPIKDMLNEQSKFSKGTEEGAVDVIESKRNVDSRASAKDDPDATECSSSFGNSTSGDENSSGLSDAEVDSQKYGNGGLGSSYDDGPSSFFPIRKKKLNSHWRTFIHPLMWRCKWAELKIKELESMASEYSRRICANDRKKRLAYEQLRVEEFCSKSLPYTSWNRREKPLKRRKRKKVECLTNTAEYMARHNLFSYLESKRNEQDGSSAGDDFGNPVFPGQDFTGSDEFAYNNDWLTQEESNDFNEEIFRKIDLVHTRVQKMKSQLDLIMTKYGAKFSSCESLSHLVPCDLPSSSVRSPTFSACNGDKMSAGGLFSSMQQMSEYDLGDFVMPDTAVSSYGEAILIPDIIESTVGLLTSVDVTQHQAHISDSCEKIVDNIFIHNDAVEMEMRTFQPPHIEAMGNHQEADVSGDEESTKPLLPKIEEPKKDATQDMRKEDSNLKSGLASEIQVPKTKRKRGERKAGSGGWSRQLPGESDSQT